MKYAIIGTGAIGGFYGARLDKAGFEVHFLLHTDYQYVVDHGLTIDSCDGNFTLPSPKVYDSTSEMPQCDVVIVALKTTQNHLLPSLLPPLLKPDTIILLIQNGIGVEADVQQLFPSQPIAAGMAFICSAKAGPGHINHQFYGNINIGNYSCHNPQRYGQMLADFRAAGIGAADVEYLEARWKKAVWNMPFNGMTVALNTTTNRLLSCESTHRLIYDQMLEVIGAAQALGVKNLDTRFADKMIANTIKMPPYSPSMKLDFDFHRPMEINYLYTRPIAEARAAGFAMPKLEMLEAELKFITLSSSTPS
ncbi:2-dehydropantoate 2-reductase [Prevotella sp. P2-180]|uniref:2-dehydropantoate 2-reductase n=1 Tax=Prevotella sp. P2-180 TaxID=2024224 RepID=UPI000B964EF7|nr:2-dehydropantoate 2-reductase [Prevotella sp. P2-180]OYP60903.1 2-dehydropantoate 2-reductase [Prevotella sp. P2-180]